jgi:hypothetical protein
VTGDELREDFEALAEPRVAAFEGFENRAKLSQDGDPASDVLFAPGEARRVGAAIQELAGHRGWA